MSGKMLWQRDLEEIQTHFQIKAELLEQYGQKVSPQDLYTDIFGDLDTLMPVVFIDQEEKKHVVKMTVAEALEQAPERNDILLGGCTYFKGYVSKDTAKDIHAFIIDMDNVYCRIFEQILEEDWADVHGHPRPMPTYMVNSGTGLHLYFVLEQPIPHYRCNAENIDKIYRALAEQQTTGWNFLRKQVQWFGQDFRMAGSLNKYNWTNEAYRTGPKWEIDELAERVGLPGTHIVREGEPRKMPVKEDKPRHTRKGWHSNPAFYEYSLQHCRDFTREGNRYMSMCALSVIAWKCNVPIARLEQDLLSLLPKYNAGAMRQIRQAEVYSAMKMYNEKAMLTQRDRLEDWQGWEYKPQRRNGRNQQEHLRAEIWQGKDGRPAVNVCAQNRELALKYMRDNGQIEGRPSKKEKVRRYRQQHPEGKPKDCMEATGISKNTVYRWWNI